VAGILAVIAGPDPRALVERAASPLLRRAWHELTVAVPAADVALGFAGERGAVETDEQTGVVIAFDGEFFLDTGVQGGLEAALELQAWAEFLAYEAPLEQHPVLVGTEFLPPASLLVVDRNGRETLHRRWRYRLEPAADADEQEWAREFGRLLDAAIARRLTPDTALTLSGGLDSRSVASILRVRAPNTVAFTWGALGSADLELGTRVASIAGLPHRRSPLTPGYIARGAAETVWLTEGHIRCFHVHFRQARQLRKSDGARSLLLNIGGDHVVRTTGGILETGGAGTDPMLFARWRAACVSDALVEELFTPAFAGEIRGRVRDGMVAAVEKQEGPPLERARQTIYEGQRRRIWPQAHLFDDELAPRDPFDDHDLIDFCRRMPERFRRGGTLQRTYLAQFPELVTVPNAQDGLPPGAFGLRRRAAAFSVRAYDAARRRAGLDVTRGIGDYAADLNHGWLLDVLLEPRTLERGQLRAAPVRRSIDETLTGRAKHTRALGVLVTFELFQRQFVDGDGHEPAAAEELLETRST
jgi:hypothetical protein